jgi:hypothetical protein
VLACNRLLHPTRFYEEVPRSDAESEQASEVSLTPEDFFLAVGPGLRLSQMGLDQVIIHMVE